MVRAARSIVRPLVALVIPVALGGAGALSTACASRYGQTSEAGDGGSGGGAPGSAPLDQGLIAHFPFDEASGTSVANAAIGVGGHDGVLLGGPIFRPSEGRIGGALDFDGVDDLVEVGGYAAIFGTPPVSVSAWIRPRSDGASGGHIVDLSHNTVGNWHLRLAGPALQFVASHNDSKLEARSTSASVVFGVWQHIAMTWDGSPRAGNARLYINGAEVSYQTQADGVGTYDRKAHPIRIGATQNRSRAFDGLIDDVRIYDWVLSAADVAALHAAAR